MIRRIGGKYIILSEKTGRRMGTYRTMARAKKRLRQIEFFKHLTSNPRMIARLRKRSLRVRTTK